MGNNCPINVKKAVMDELLTNYNLKDIDKDMFAYLNHDLHQCFQQFDDPHVALEEGCPKEFWTTNKIKAKVNKINEEKKTLLHHSSSRHFSYRMEARRKEVASLRSELVSYKSQMSILVQALSSSGIRLLGFSAPSPLGPFHIGQAQQSGPLTSDPIPNQQQDYQAPPSDMPIDFSAFFFIALFPLSFKTLYLYVYFYLYYK
ncbi:hypothetical protein D8674_037545 [Pyrus ussuriensis x Pyrus communis]|uniref:Uncharacterized protein n=1 Tax=Pyrus ussuriensis x Pyrus communis TaxID=2448454 RepID=A0A5N5GKX3_9ROSA|nr:hypothetical protein D8674_037545 [Pyrus ussuriensis x Pyrus communis]